VESRRKTRAPVRFTKGGTPPLKRTRGGTLPPCQKNEGGYPTPLSKTRGGDPLPPVLRKTGYHPPMPAPA